MTGVALAGALLSACSDAAVTLPEAFEFNVAVTVSGVDRDESFLVSLDGREPQSVSPVSPFLFRDVSGGKHVVALSALAENCAIEGENPVVVQTSSAQRESVIFRVACTAARGVITATVSVSGSWDPGWFRVQVNTDPARWIQANQTTLLGSFAGGSHTVRLRDIPELCRASDEASRSVSVKTGGLVKDTAHVSIEVTCEGDPGLSAGEPLIAFQRGSSIAVVREDGSGLSVLAEGQDPAWSPERDHLVFHVPVCFPWGCNAELWSFALGTSRLTRITSGDGFMDGGAAISPDGQRVAFIRFWHGPDQSYLVMTSASGTNTEILSIWHPVSTPDWSPNGKQIVFTCEPQVSHSGLDLCIVSTAETCTSYFVNVCQLPPPAHLMTSSWTESEPSWSPDGRLIAFTFVCDGASCPFGLEARTSFVALFDPETRAFEMLVPGSSPSWSPDGRRIVFVGNEKEPGLAIVNADGSGLRRLTDDPRDSAPSWK